MSTNPDLYPLTAALRDALEAAYVNAGVREAISANPGALNALDLIIDFANDHEEELEHFLRWETLNRRADDRVVDLHQTRVDALLEVNVHAGNATIDAMEKAEAEITRGGTISSLDESVPYTHAREKWNRARRAHDHAAEVQADLEEVLEAATESDAYHGLTHEEAQAHAEERSSA